MARAAAAEEERPRRKGRTLALTQRPLPPIGKRHDLPGRGALFVRSMPGPKGARPVVLIHGWIASGGLNWFQAFDLDSDEGIQLGYGSSDSLDQAT